MIFSSLHGLLSLRRYDEVSLVKDHYHALYLGEGNRYAYDDPTQMICDEEEWHESIAQEIIKEFKGDRDNDTQRVSRKASRKFAQEQKKTKPTQESKKNSRKHAGSNTHGKYIEQEEDQSDSDSEESANPRKYQAANVKSIKTSGEKLRDAMDQVAQAKAAESKRILERQKRVRAERKALKYHHMSQ